MKLVKNKNIAALFDLDGVIIDTEPQYDRFWNSTAEKYGVGTENFCNLVKGLTLPNIIARYFSHLSENEQNNIVAANHEFDLQLDTTPISGAIEFIAQLKQAGIKLGLVTSSDDEKLAAVYAKLPLLQYFDTVVSADRITAGKPDPMCYLLAAADLGVKPSDCFVFEDSFNGIASGNAAGMQIIGLSTTNSEESIRGNVDLVIPDFQGFTIEKMLDAGKIIIPSLDEIGEAADKFIRKIGSNTVFAFRGEMGAGKTTFIKAVCERLGVKDVINSPTFAIVNEYFSEVRGEPVYHFDFYRIRSVGEALDIGARDYFGSGNLCFIEWPEMVEQLLPEDTVYVHISEMPDGRRSLDIAEAIQKKTAPH
jgi:tRNA threonylcarbamoyl adenosine modification protein YjeE